MTWPGPGGRAGVPGNLREKPRESGPPPVNISLTSDVTSARRATLLSRPEDPGPDGRPGPSREYYVNLAALCKPGREPQGTLRESGGIREQIVNISLSRSCFRPQGQSFLPAGAPWPEAGPGPPRGDGREHFGNTSGTAGGGPGDFPGKGLKSAINSGRKRIFLLSFAAWNPSSNTSCGYPPYSRTP